eukprot:UN18051
MSKEHTDNTCATVCVTIDEPCSLDYMINEHQFVFKECPDLGYPHALNPDISYYLNDVLEVNTCGSETRVGYFTDILVLTPDPVPCDGQSRYWTAVDNICREYCDHGQDINNCNLESIGFNDNKFNMVDELP